MTRPSGKRDATHAQLFSAGEIHLREYRPQDFETLWEIDQVCYEPRIAYSRPAMRHFLKAPRADCVVAEIGGKIAGFCITARNERDATEGYIVTIDVLAEFRRRGAGAALLAEAENRMAASGVRAIALDTAVDNFTAISFWERHGYRKIGIRKSYYPTGVDAFAMSKAIAR